MVVGERHRILRRAGPLCRAHYGIRASRSAPTRAARNSPKSKTGLDLRPGPPCVARPNRTSRQDWPEYCLFFLAWVAPSLRCNSCPWSGRLTPFARPGQGLFCIPLSFCPARAVVLHQYHTSYPLYAGRDFVEVLTKCRAQHFFRGKDRFVAAGGSVKQQDEGLGISPISVLLAEPVANLK